VGSDGIDNSFPFRFIRVAFEPNKNDTRMPQLATVDQFAKVLILRDEDRLFVLGQLEHRPVRYTGRNLGDPTDGMAIGTQA